jgi:hypothetical protein
MMRPNPIPPITYGSMSWIETLKAIKEKIIKDMAIRMFHCLALEQ